VSMAGTGGSHGFVYGEPLTIVMHWPAGVGLCGVAVMPADLRHGAPFWLLLFQELDPCSVSPSVIRATSCRATPLMM
jgi:hypothetical protein